MSQNITLTRRRSADEGGSVEAAAADGAESAKPRLPPHAEQKFAEGGFVAPHAGQRTGNRAPHSLQKRAPSGICALQTWQSMP
jgi:hypothetical protein